MQRPWGRNGKDLVLRNRKPASVAGQLDGEGQEEIVLVSQAAKIRFIFSVQGNHRWLLRRRVAWSPSGFRGQD